MKLELHQITPDAEKSLVEIARVSSSRSDKTEDIAGLIRYLIENKHWSPFEHAHMTFSIETSKAIGIQLLRHRSFSFQEFSQRYQDVGQLDAEMFQHIDLRKQAANNRQSSTESMTPDELGLMRERVSAYLEATEELYDDLLSRGVARECARMVLPMATTTVIHMTGSIRSWIHFLEIRDDAHAQLEIQEIARRMKFHFCLNLPTTAEALGWSA